MELLGDENFLKIAYDPKARNKILINTGFEEWLYDE